MGLVLEGTVPLLLRLLPRLAARPLPPPRGLASGLVALGLASAATGGGCRHHLPLQLACTFILAFFFFFTAARRVNRLLTFR